MPSLPLRLSQGETNQIQLSEKVTKLNSNQNEKSDFERSNPILIYPLCHVRLNVTEEYDDTQLDSHGYEIKRCIAVCHGPMSAGRLVITCHVLT